MEIKVNIEHVGKFYILEVTEGGKEVQHVSIPDDLSTETYNNEKWAIEGTALAVASCLTRYLKHDKAAE